MLKNRPSSSSSSLHHFLRSATVAAMSLRPSSSYRGGRNQWRGRGFSNRPYSPDTDNIVYGNDETNREIRPDYNPRPQRFQIRPNSDASFNQNHSVQPRRQPPPPYSNPYQQFAPPPLYNQNQQFWRYGQPQPHFNPNRQFRPPPVYNQGQHQPSFDQNQQLRSQGPPSQGLGQFRPQQRPRQRSSKPLDYRNWENAKPGPPPTCERFTVLSYNILADYLAINHRSKLYFHVPRHILDWEFRKKNIMFELGLWSADILCFQEVDRFQDFEEDLKVRGYSGIWKMRTGEPVDGCAIFWRSSRFKLLHEEAIEFNKFGLRDNVAQICVLESLNDKSSTESPPPTCSEGHNKVVICNIHVLFNPKRGEIKLGQVRVLLDKAYATSKLWDNAPIVLCGDYNSTPKSSLYNFISEGKLDVSEVPRDKISGQNSPEMRPSKPFIRAQLTNNATQSPKNEESDTKSDSTNGQPECSQPGTTQEDEKNVPQLKSTEERLENISSDSISNGISIPTQELNQLHLTTNDDVSISADETLLTTSPDEQLKANKDVAAVVVGEDSASFLSELNSPDGSHIVDPTVETPEVFNGSWSPAYDPSGWTPMEIKAATGDSECTTMEHPLKLTSTYTEVEDYSGTRDSNGEPQVTSYHRGFQGTVDYIWRSNGVETVKVLAPIPKHAMEWTPGFPTKRWGSDHIALVTEFAFKDTNEEKQKLSS